MCHGFISLNYFWVLKYIFWCAKKLCIDVKELAGSIVRHWPVGGHSVMLTLALARNICFDLDSSWGPKDSNIY